MEIIRGTTPTIEINIKSDIDLSAVAQVWVYISQFDRVKVDKLIQDVEIQAESKKILVKLEQTDTLKLESGKAMFQIRLLLEDGTALATVASEVSILQVYKGGVIE